MGGGSRAGWIRGKCIGRGSTATVYLAASSSANPGSFFAVKSAGISCSAPLQREQKMLSSLFSPSIVSCLGSDVTAEPDGRVLYNLFMEYVPGGSLAEEIKQYGGLDKRTIRLYARGILSGLAYLHSRGIVHCDIKGQNILVGGDGRGVKLADLGCARWADGRDGGGVISGTPLYMAPEAARGEAQGPAADIWALGCTVIEMATGCPPWRDVADPVAAIHRIAFSADVPELPCNISDDARDFLDRCLNRDPMMRWSAEELLNHPFINCDEESTRGCISDPKWRSSPKSTLDQVFWDTWQEEDDTKLYPDDQPPESVQNRFRQLVGGGVSPRQETNATWDETCWITVRNSEGLETLTGDDEPSTSGGSWQPTATADVIHCEEDPAGYRDQISTTVVTHSSNSSLRSIGDVDTINSSVVLVLAEGKNLVEIHKFSEHFNRNEMSIDVYDYLSLS